MRSGTSGHAGQQPKSRYDPAQGDLESIKARHVNGQDPVIPSPALQFGAQYSPRKTVPLSKVIGREATASIGNLSNTTDLPKIHIGQVTLRTVETVVESLYSFVTHRSSRRFPCCS